MEKSSKRGKIPQSDWPLIMARYEAGETLASIARTYDCSPPAISYVVSRSRARPLLAEVAAKPAAPPPEPQLIKAVPVDPTANGIAQPLEAVAPTAGSTAAVASLAIAAEAVAIPPGRSDRADVNHPRPGATGSRDGDGIAERHAEPSPSSPTHPASPSPRHEPPGQRPFAAGAPNAANGDHRRTLHLSLRGPQFANGNPPATDSLPHEPPVATSDNRPPPQQNGDNRAAAPTHSGQQLPHAQPYQHGADSGAALLSEPRSTPYRGDARNNGDGATRRDAGGTFIDQELRTRVDADIAAFLAAFDAALAQDTEESRSGLREATDRLLRAGARTRIELERLEARVPLSRRDGGMRNEPVWRHR